MDYEDYAYSLNAGDIEDTVYAMQFTGENTSDLQDFVENFYGSFNCSCVTSGCTPKTYDCYIENWQDEKTRIYLNDYVVVDSFNNWSVINEDDFKSSYSKLL